jgi:hypothetical protein
VVAAERNDPGGIEGLYRLLTEHGEALEADLQRHFGVNLPELVLAGSWRRLGVLVRHLPRDSVAVHRTAGDAALWGTVEHLLAEVIDLLANANWQRQGRKGAPRPKRLPRPGQANANEKRFGTESVSIDEYHRRRGGRHHRKG